jgi:hypothetical protein
LYMYQKKKKMIYDLFCMYQKKEENDL